MGSMVLGAIHRQAVGHTFEVVAGIGLGNLEMDIEEHTARVDTMEVPHIAVNHIVASLDNIEVAEHIKVVDFDDDARLLLL